MTKINIVTTWKPWKMGYPFCHEQWFMCCLYRCRIWRPGAWIGILLLSIKRSSFVACTDQQWYTGAKQWSM